MDAQSTSYSQECDDCVCRICAQTNCQSDINIFDNFLIYKKLHVSFLEIIKDVLELEIDKDDRKSCVMCGECKTKLVEFYRFKKKSKSIEKLQEECMTNDEMIEKLYELDKQIEDKTVYSTLQIIRHYIEKNSVSSINVEESTKKLTIMPKSVRKDPLQGVCVKQENDLEDVDEIYIFQNFENAINYPPTTGFTSPKSKKRKRPSTDQTEVATMGDLRKLKSQLLMQMTCLKSDVIRELCTKLSKYSSNEEDNEISSSIKIANLSKYLMTDPEDQFDPPAFLPDGMEDTILPVKSVEEFRLYCDKLNDSEYFEYQVSVHRNFMAASESENTQKMIRKLLRGLVDLEVRALFNFTGRSNFHDVEKIPDGFEKFVLTVLLRTDPMADQSSLPKLFKNIWNRSTDLLKKNVRG